MAGRHPAFEVAARSGSALLAGRQVGVPNAAAARRGEVPGWDTERAPVGPDDLERAARAWSGNAHEQEHAAALGAHHHRPLVGVRLDGDLWEAGTEQEG